MSPICPICKSADAVCAIQTWINEWDCPRCGRFVVDQREGSFIENFDGPTRTRLSAIIREQTIKRLPRVCLLVSIKELPEKSAVHEVWAIHYEELIESKWPTTVSEKLDRVLTNLCLLSERGGHRFRLSSDDPAVMFAEDHNEGSYIINSLIDLGHIQSKGGTMLDVTPKGWERFYEITRKAGSPENPVFVAMWFGEGNTKADMDKAYLDGIKPAVEQAGYKVTRADMEEHNEYIMEKILGDIRLAPFLIADFTGHRNGVYYEAGFARGLGIPVINCCKKTAFDKAHFDTKQLNHILWNDANELRERLCNRIVGSIGHGPNVQESIRPIMLPE